MKYIFYALISLPLFISCKTSRNYLEHSESDNTLYDAVKSLKKRNSDTAAITALPVLYNLAQQRHLKKVNNYTASKEIDRWDKIIKEYTAMQNIHDAIVEAGNASRVVKPADYQQTIHDLKQQAAENYYVEAALLADRPGKDNAKKAYAYFKKADAWAPGYRDAKQKMDEAYQNAIVNVQVNPVIDNSFFFNTGWGNYGYNYSNEYFQQTLVRDLGGQNSNRYPARFYTDWQARRDNIQPDLLVDLTLKNIQISPNTSYTYNRNASRQVETGSDSSGRKIYETVYATVRITRQTYSGFAEMLVDITDVASRKLVSSNTYRENYDRQEEYATYSGDGRALSANDWSLVNNRTFNEPAKEEILNELYRKIYPQVRNRISYTVDW